MSKVEILKSVSVLRSFVSEQRKQGLTLAFVPTMGALHDGHLELVREGLKRADICFASVFVNPTQFGPNEDFDAYPRQLEEDRKKLESVGAHAVFAPTAAEMYPEGFATNVTISGITEVLEGAHRPGHFDGVATVVAKLLLQAMPDVALFGQKDYQQLQVIKRLVADLNVPVEIIGVPTVRDENGLALSSRNAYLDEAQSQIAIQLNKILFTMAERIKAGEEIGLVRQWGLDALAAAKFDSVDYLAVCDASNLRDVTAKENQELRILAAVKLGKARLIDNIAS